MPPVPACNGYRPEVRGYVIYSSRATHEGNKSHNPSLQADNPYIKSFSPADCKEILLKDKVTKYLIQKFFKFLWPLLHKKFNIWHVSVKIRKKRPMSKLILADQGAASWDDRMFVVKVYCYGKLSP